MKNLCACGCNFRVSVKNNKGKRSGRKYASGHNQFSRAVMERIPSRTPRFAPKEQ